MATKITEECINCGACEPECPNTAIYAGGVQYELKGNMVDALATDFYYIVPEKCTECVGHFDKEQCAAVCPVDCCVPDGDRTETEEALLAKAKTIHPDRDFPALSAETSHFRKG
jgi:ferredoxin